MNLVFIQVLIIYEGDVIVGDHFPNEELITLKSRFYNHYYKHICRLGGGV